MSQPQKDVEPSFDHLQHIPSSVFQTHAVVRYPILCTLTPASYTVEARWMTEVTERVYIYIYTKSTYLGNKKSFDIVMKKIVSRYPFLWGWGG